MNEALWLKIAAEKFPSAPALAHGKNKVSTFADLSDAVSRVAGGLLSRQLKIGDRVAIFAANTPSYITALYSIWWAGLVAVPINAKLHEDEVTFILEHAEISHLLISDQTVQVAAKSVEKCNHDVSMINLDDLNVLKKDFVKVHPSNPDDLAWLFYTSGTTGKPKGAMLTFKNLDEMTTQFLSCIASVDKGDAIIHAAPLSHGSGLYTLPHIRNGACQVIPESGGFNVEELSELLDHWSGVSMFAAPTMVNRLVRSDVDLNDTRLKNLKTIIYGGAPMYANDAEQALLRLGSKLAQIYGQGESPMTITYLDQNALSSKNDPKWRNILGSVGIAFPNVEVAIKTNDGEIVNKDASGEVVVRGDIVMAGYWKQPEATAAAIQNGWLHTGDIGSISTEGYLTLLDRSKDLIISGGSNIYPREVEEILLTHPGVEDVSIIGRYDDDWGEIVIAYYVGAATPEELDQHCLNHIARFKRPKEYIAIDNLPKSHYGKILKSELRKIDRYR